MKKSINKILMAGASAVFMISAPAGSITAVTQENPETNSLLILGDVDLNGKVDMSDITTF